ncbi:MAG: peptide ABC transporter substrate-binding protein [Deltaproteobacteria bacterium CG_4_10_14_0_2_um_filter_43_8]|nr:MAG: peptide ABC transporter substrate-binding protein [Deltaproteobacteria bacterium CG11_big_fil_rev_8_21_14_0_20_42_23]PJA21218.1 MAG: peptide ABC transporter substrate-binding protein [Deltaproteobacteria bacterium CG_4_10_14_0_2_um_filter_43_8]PJC63498.1 MAG: peptide ABC transporter substrate-binding protein [Deltaproteobacteria bacterium CG_4_9_14_0_2_um_filter_42_21]
MSEQNMKPLVEVKNLKIYFPIEKGLILKKKVGAIKAVDGISFSIMPGETLGLVGESGCGKSTTGRALIQLIKPTDGEILFEGKNLTSLSNEELRKKRQDFQMIFQDPYGSLNPRMTVGDIIAEPLKTYNIAKGKPLERMVQDLLYEVGLNPRFIRRYPHEFSGGQRQRIGIARALALKPKFIVCDEPISALDVSIQAQILNLLDELKKRHHLTLLFIAHDLAAVRHISDRVAVMYLGKIVEIAPKKMLFENPSHPYTQALMSAVPIPDPLIQKKRQRIVLVGDVPSPINTPCGCRFHSRCPKVMTECRSIQPKLKEYEADQYVSCHYDGTINITIRKSLDF